MGLQFCCFLIFMVLSIPASANQILLATTDGLDAPISLQGHLHVLCVPDSDEGIDQISAPERAMHFTNLPGMLAKGYTGDTCWLRFTLMRSKGAPAEWLLEAGLPYLDEVTLYQPFAKSNIPRSTSEKFQSLRLGDRFPSSQRPVPHRQFVFPITLEEDQPTNLYLRIKTSSSLVVDTLDIWQPTGLIASSQTESAFYWFVFGIISLGAISNIVFWFWLGERVYYLYAQYLCSILLINLASSGHLGQWFLSDSPIIADRSIGVFTALVFLTGFVFFNEALQLKNNFQILTKVMPMVISFYIICIFFSALGNYGDIAPLLQLVALAVTTIIALSGPIIYLRGNKQIKFYIIAFSTQIFVAIAVIVRNLGYWPVHAPVDHFVLLATGIHVLLLNFALAERIQRIQQEKLKMEQVAARLEASEVALAQQLEFAAMAAHEFRTPLAIIDTCAQRIEGSTKKDIDKINDRCKSIRLATNRMIKLMEDFLNHERINSELRQFSPSRINPKETIELIAHGFDRNELILALDNSPEHIECDPALFQLALSNLLTNAIRHSATTQPVHLSATKAGKQGITIIVSDQGTGIPADELERIFDKYFRGRSSKNTPGTGLGLFLVKTIAELHGGTVKVKSTPGEGSVFELRLP